MSYALTGSPSISKGMLVIGIGLVIASLLVDNIILSGGLGLFGVTFLWGIYELLKQEKRVAQGLFPRNPRRQD